MTEEYKAYLAHMQKGPPIKEDFIAHYGVKGQKWGVRNYQYANGGYTPEGAQRYWGGTGQGRQRAMGGPARPGGVSRGYVSTQRNGMRMGTKSGPVSSNRLRTGTKTAASRDVHKQLTPEQQARRARTKKVLAIGAGVAVAAALGYAAYKGSTNLRDQQRADVLKNFNTDWRNVNTLNSKYWDTADRRKFNEISQQRAKDVASSITRRDAVAAKFAEKTGVRINLPQSREAVMRQRRNENAYANTIREFENRGALNRRISDARKDLQRVQRDAQRSADTRFKSQERMYGEHLNSQWDKQIEQRREILNNLLLQRRNAS